MTSKWSIAGAATFCALALAQTATAAPTCNTPQILHLPGLRAGGSAVVERRSSVSVDRTACYQINLRGGVTTLSVRLFSNDADGYLRLYNPDWSTKREGPGWVFSGRTLPGAGDGDHATRWKGPAPLGNVLIVVNLGGAGRQYRLRVEAN